MAEDDDMLRQIESKNALLRKSPPPLTSLSASVTTDALALAAKKLKAEQKKSKKLTEMNQALTTEIDKRDKSILKKKNIIKALEEQNKKLENMIQGLQNELRGKKLLQSLMGDPEEDEDEDEEEDEEDGLGEDEVEIAEKIVASKPNRKKHSPAKRSPQKNASKRKNNKTPSKTLSDSRRKTAELARQQQNADRIEQQKYNFITWKFLREKKWRFVTGPISVSGDSVYVPPEYDASKGADNIENVHFFRGLSAVQANGGLLGFDQYLGEYQDCQEDDDDMEAFDFDDDGEGEDGRTAEALKTATKKSAKKKPKKTVAKEIPPQPEEQHEPSSSSSSSSASESSSDDDEEEEEHFVATKTTLRETIEVFKTYQRELRKDPSIDFNVFMQSPIYQLVSKRVSKKEHKWIYKNAPKHDLSTNYWYLPPGVKSLTHAMNLPVGSYESFGGEHTFDGRRMVYVVGVKALEYFARRRARANRKKPRKPKHNFTLEWLRKTCYPDSSENLASQGSDFVEDFYGDKIGTRGKGVTTSPPAKTVKVKVVNASKKVKKAKAKAAGAEKGGKEKANEVATRRKEIVDSPGSDSVQLSQGGMKGVELLGVLMGDNKKMEKAKAAETKLSSKSEAVTEAKEKRVKKNKLPANHYRNSRVTREATQALVKKRLNDLAKMATTESTSKQGTPTPTKVDMNQQLNKTKIQKSTTLTTPEMVNGSKGNINIDSNINSNINSNSNKTAATPSPGKRLRTILSGYKFLLCGLPEDAQKEFINKIEFHGGCIMGKNGGSMPVLMNELRDAGLLGGGGGVAVGQDGTSWSGKKRRIESTDAPTSTTASGLATRTRRANTFFLSTPTNRRKPKYLLACACRIPMVHYKWLDDIIKAQNAFDEVAYNAWRLPLGLPVSDSEEVDDMNLAYVLQKGTHTRMAGERILKNVEFVFACDENDNKFVRGNWESILYAMGAMLYKEGKKAATVHVIVDSINLPPHNIAVPDRVNQTIMSLKNSPNIGDVIVVDISWVVQSIVCQQQLELSTNSSFLIDLSVESKVRGTKIGQRRFERGDVIRWKEGNGGGGGGGTSRIAKIKKVEIDENKQYNATVNLYTEDNNKVLHGPAAFGIKLDGKKFDRIFTSCDQVILLKRGDYQKLSYVSGGENSLVRAWNEC